MPRTESSNEPDEGFHASVSAASRLALACDTRQDSGRRRTRRSVDFGSMQVHESAARCTHSRLIELTERLLRPGSSENRPFRDSHECVRYSKVRIAPRTTCDFLVIGSHVFHKERTESIPHRPDFSLIAAEEAERLLRGADQGLPEVIAPEYRPPKVEPSVAYDPREACRAE